MLLVTDGTGPRWGWGAGGGDVRWVMPEDASALDAVDPAQPPTWMDMPGPEPAPASDAVLARRGDESGLEVAMGRVAQGSLLVQGGRCLRDMTRRWQVCGVARK